jgi:hypothetical protein
MVGQLLKVYRWRDSSNLRRWGLSVPWRTRTVALPSESAV